MKKFFDSKVPELVALVVQIIALTVVAFVKPCSFTGFVVGLAMGFIITKIIDTFRNKKKKAVNKWIDLIEEYGGNYE